MAVVVQVRFEAPHVPHRPWAWARTPLLVMASVIAGLSFVVWLLRGRDDGFLSFLVWTPLLIALVGLQFGAVLWILHTWLGRQLRKGPPQLRTHGDHLEIHTPNGSYSFHPRDVEIQLADGSWHIATDAVKVDVEQSLVGRTDRRRLEAWAAGKRAPRFAWF